MMPSETSLQQGLFSMLSGLLGTGSGVDGGLTPEGQDFSSIFSGLLEESGGESGLLERIEAWLEQHHLEPGLWPDQGASPAGEQPGEDTAALAPLLAAMAAKRFRPASEGGERLPLSAANAGTSDGRGAAGANSALNSVLAQLDAMGRGRAPLAQALGASITTSQGDAGEPAMSRLSGLQAPVAEPPSLAAEGTTFKTLLGDLDSAGLNGASTRDIASKLAALVSAMSAQSEGRSVNARSEHSGSTSTTAFSSTPVATPGTANATEVGSRLTLPAQHPGFAQALGEQVRMLFGQGGGRALIRLDPPHLGSLEIQMQTEGEQTRVQFIAANPAARDALEQALPRLREMFAEQGQRVDAQVSERGDDGASRGGQGSGQDGEAEAPLNPLYQSADADGDESASDSPSVISGLGLVDAYA